MRYRGVASDEVKAHVHSTFVSFGAEVLKIFVRAVARSDLKEISNIVACITKRRLINGIDPDRVAAD